MKHLKRTIAILLTLLMLVTSAPFAVFAGTDECNHKWIDYDTNPSNMKAAATCKTKAVYYYRCRNCGKSAKDVSGCENNTYEAGEIDPNGHVYSDWVYPTGYDCTVGGEISRTCTLCSKPDKKTMPAGQHVGKEVQAEVPATCTVAGTKAKIVCEVCGVTTQEPDPIPAGHKGGTATCKAQAVCTVCGLAYGELDSTNHTAIEHVVAKEAKCNTAGNIEYWKCNDCEKFFSDAQCTTEITDKTTVVINPVGTEHENLKKIEAKNSTCKDKGNIEHWYCDACGKRYSDAAATQEITEAQAEKPLSTEHTWGAWTYPEGYTCAAGGKLSRTCSVCGKTEEKTLNPGEHAELMTEPAIPPTCTTEGKTAKIYCRKCGNVVQPAEAVPAAGHQYSGAVATGKGDGTHTLACTVCGKAGDPIECVDADRDCVCDVCKQQLAHTFTNYVSDGNATCAEDGTETATCDVCGKKTNTRTEVGSKDDAPHQYEWVDLNDATCIANGHKRGTCTVCGNVTTQEITNSATGHKESDWLYPDGFDCEVGGTRYKRCTVCGDTLANEYIEGHAHSEVIDPEVPKTCTTDGRSAGIHCDICGKIIKAQAIYKAEGHKANADGFTTTIEPTCTADGAKTATCAVCGEVFTEVIPKNGHSYTDTIVAPTCEGAGYTLHHCTVCGDEVRDNISSATGHKMVENIKPATTENNGKVVQTCKVCGKKVADKVYRIKKIALNKTTFVRSSKKNTPTVIVTDAKGNKLKKNVDYTVKYASGRKAIGTYKVVVTFKGEYSGKKTLKFKVVPPIVKSVKATAGKGSATLTWARNKFADLYVIYRATEKDGKYKKIGTTSDLTYTATKLASGKTYYFKVRAVRKLDSGNYYSDYSAIRKATIK